MNRFSIGSRLLVGFSIVTILLLAVIGAGVSSLSKSEDQLGNVKRITMLSSNVARVQAYLKTIDESIKGLILHEEQSDKDKQLAAIEGLKSKYREALDIVDKNTKTPEGKKLITELKEAVGAEDAVNQKMIAAAVAGDSATFRQLMNGEGDKAVARVSKGAEALLTFYEKRVGVRVDDAVGSSQTATRIMYAFGLAALILSVLTAIVITRGITGPLHECVNVADRIADGDLTVSVAADQGRSETSHLMRTMNNMIVRMRGAMERVSQASGAVSSAAVKLHAASQNMVNGTSEVASQASTVATSGEEMASTSLDIAGSCNAAAESSRHANDLATSGAHIVQSTVDGMERIAERVRATARNVESLGARSDQIGAIISTIEDIADQTNLLALNAAIEAARAGEQGRGFAVVADEVRALAERTTRATREIGEMIKAIQTETRQAVISMEEGVNEVEHGTEGASRSGGALQEILSQINDVTGQINQIATAAEEQSSTSRDISNNMHQITEIIQETAKGTHETAQASDQLSRLATDLESLVRQFRL
ncbi:methyl-accepting chemotaxis protein [Geobacter sp. SVR]|uniref:methyl-accepting chemotaxis protein n=1 Tax=Geobacter sp. SVR TaxID=2495594 RepID=UPI00143EF54D|nr:methyl-accepting chemotaxis protein [Geobacter sp. SVR]BCS52323.1 methyl-accepting chemotaxis protein [Geobacter sp. SVR]GCF85018.1 methyl-accepting chemotaxis protein [Geobacter sp. SVR]